MKRRDFWNSWEGRTTIALVVVAVGLNLISIPLGLAWGKGGYLTKVNWSLYPLFFALCGVLAYASWEYYMDAWKGLAANGVVYEDENPVEKFPSLDLFLSSFVRRRRIIVAISFVLGVVITIVDMGCLWSEYGIMSSRTACEERDFSVAFNIPSVFPNASVVGTIVFNIFAYSMQASLIMLGFLSLSQISMHGWAFFRFEKLSIIKNKALSIKLNYKDPLREFGVSDINRAINTMYITIAMSMIAPMLSAVEQETAAVDFGQLMLRYILPLIILAPLIIPFADRFFRHNEAVKRARAAGSPEELDKLREQKLWPFDGGPIGYAGKVAFLLVFSEYVFLFKMNFLDLLPG